MRREERLFAAIGLVDDRLVEEAADGRRAAVRPARRWLPLAACLVLALGLGAGSLSVMMRGCSSADTAATADTAVGSESTATTTDGAENTAESADTTDSAAESTETTEDAAVSEPPETPSDGAADDAAVPEGPEAADEEATDGAAGESYQETAGSAMVLPLTADADGLTAERTVTAADGVITDRYLVANGGSGAVTVAFRYPAALAGAVTVGGADAAASAGTWTPYPDGPVTDVTWYEAVATIGAGETVTVTATLSAEAGTYTVWRDAASRLTFTAVTVDGAPADGETAALAAEAGGSEE